MLSESDLPSPAASLAIPAPIEAVIMNFDARTKPFNCHDVHSALSAVRQTLPDQAPDENKGAWAEVLAFGLAARDHGEKPWGTWFGPMGSGTQADGATFYFPDAREADVAVLNHWKLRAKVCQAPILRARYSDLVWDLSMLIADERRDASYARLAIDAYLAAALQPGRDSYDSFPDAERALILAIQLADGPKRDAARQIMLDLHKVEMASGGMWWRTPETLAEQPKAGLTETEHHSLIADLETRSRPSRWCNFGCGRGPSSGGFGGDV